MYEKFGRAEKLLMRIRSLKWQAATKQSTSDSATMREETARIVADLDNLERAARAASTEAAFTAGEQETDRLAVRLMDLTPT